MKAGLLVAALSAVAIAQPHVRHQQLHEEKRDVVVTQYETDVVTATAQGAVVYVDQYGNKINEAPAATPSPDTKQNWAPQQNNHPAAAPSSSTQAPPPPPAATSSAAAVVNAPAAPAPAASSAAAVVNAPAAPAPAKSSAAASSPSSSPQQGSTGGGIASGVGTTYSPYTASGCKTEAQIVADLQILKGYSSFRVYNTDCKAVSIILKTLSSATVMVGVNNEKIFDVAGQVSAITAEVGSNWSRVEAVAVGNEAVNGGVHDAGTMAAQVSAFKTALKGAGVSTKVITVDTAVAIVANKALCTAGDFVAANSHAFWNGAVAAGDAGPFVLKSAQDVANACPGANVVITESGWPNSGPSFKNSVASTANTAACVGSLQGSFKNNLYLFNAFNTPNVQDPAQSHWGVHGDSAAQ